MRSECEACTQCADPNCRRDLCTDWNGWQDAAGQWFCDDHLEPTGPPDCPTCGDSGEVGDGYTREHDTGAWVTAPCPDCSLYPTSSLYPTRNSA